MYNLEFTESKINEIVSNYNELIEHTKRTISHLSNYDRHYYTGKGVEAIFFEKGRVFVEYDDGCRGHHIMGHSSFPIEWLRLTHEELLFEVLKLEEKEKEQKREKEKARKLEIETKEREQYEKLKKKFENQQ